MKKKVILAMCIAAALALAGCGSGSNGQLRAGAL